MTTAIVSNSKSITIPFFRVGVPPYAREDELKETILACRQALEANKKAT